MQAIKEASLASSSLSDDADASTGHALSKPMLEKLHAQEEEEDEEGLSCEWAALLGRDRYLNLT
jgi:hypothetical protein